MRKNIPEWLQKLIEEEIEENRKKVVASIGYDPLTVPPTV